MLDKEMPHDDMPQDVEMIKNVLQKIIDEMDSMEADRLMPESRKPKMVEAKIEAHPMEQGPEEDSEEDASLLPSLMEKAPHADDEGALPEDKEDDVEPEIAHIVAEKKKLSLPK